MVTAFKKAAKGVVYDLSSDEYSLVTGRYLAEKANFFKFTPINEDSLVSESVGFVDALDIYTPFNDAETEYNLKEFNFFALRTDTRTIPSDTLKLEVAKRVEALKKETNVPNIAKKELQTIITHTRMALIQKMPVRTKTVLVVFNESEKILTIWGAPEKTLTHIEQLLFQGIEARIHPLSIPEFAQIVDKENGLKNYDALLGTMENENVIADTTAIGELSTWLWHLSETMGDAKYFFGRKDENASRFGVSINGDSLVVGSVDEDGSAIETLSSKEANHAHIRYALWKNEKLVVSSIHNMTTETGNIDIAFSLNSCSSYQFGLDLKKMFHKKAIEKSAKIPAKFCASNLFDDEKLRGDYDVWLSNLLDAQETALFEALSCQTLFIKNLAYMVNLYTLARISPKRWKGTWDKVMEWLMMYVPECERVNFDSSQEKKA